MGFWHYWIIASTVGGVLGYAFTESVRFITAFVDSGLAVLLVNVLAAILGAIIGAITAVAQWPVLRRQITRNAWWMSASITCGVAGLVLLFILEGSGGFGSVLVGSMVHHGGALFGAMVGAISTLAQWVVVRPQVAQMLARKLNLTGGYAIAVGGAVMSLATSFTYAFATDSSADIIYAALYGAISGGALLWVFCHTESKARNRTPLQDIGD